MKRRNQSIFIPIKVGVNSLLKQFRYKERTSQMAVISSSFVKVGDIEYEYMSSKAVDVNDFYTMYDLDSERTVYTREVHCNTSFIFGTKALKKTDRTVPEPVNNNKQSTVSIQWTEIREQDLLNEAYLANMN
ncbi:hypothetical protein SLH46_14665 [Draconibacterium sp. IB214405]|uniref:hypothetical protein n=1 Tax=Draconibacterium sp. IB214405 TaxID=3097352 RepID=UPI002A10943D|nr:hypothetical protein [Draconibacterium sp. IB214405]MDX8340442.1 hypothetical protein [Draconibacterium sp. IB214405]